MVDFTLTDEQKDLRELAHSFAEKDMRNVAWEYDKDGTWPQDVIEKAWEVGLMNTHVPEAYGGPGLDYLSGCLIEEEFGWGCSGIGTSLAANGLASAPITLGGSEETKKKYLGMLTEAPKLCLLRPDRARRRLRRPRDEDQGREEGRQVRHQRLQVLHHQRHLRRLLHGLRQDRPRGRSPRHQRLRRRRRPPRGLRRQEGGQDGSAGLQHRDHLLRRSRDPGREPPGRGKQGLQTGDDDPRPDPSRRLGDGRRHRPRRPRVRHGLLERTGPVRRPDRDAPGDPVHDRRHGDQGRGRPAC